MISELTRWKGIMLYLCYSSGCRNRDTNKALLVYSAPSCMSLAVLQCYGAKSLPRHNSPWNPIFAITKSSSKGRCLFERSSLDPESMKRGYVN